MIFDEQISRKPNHYPWTKEFIDAMHQGFWTSAEFSFIPDLQQFHALPDVEKDIVVKTLSAISQIEISVKKFWAKLGDNLPHPSLTDLGFVFANTEVIHNEAYERLLSVLGIEDIFEQNLQVEVIQGRVNYLRKYLHKYYKDSKKQYVYSLILFSLFVENVSLFSQFYIIVWFNRYKHSLTHTGQQVDYTRAEENLHALAGIKIINTIRKEHPELFDIELEELIVSHSKEAFKAESKIIDWILKDYNQEFLDSNIVKEFIKNRLNQSLAQIDFPKAFEINEDLLDQSNWFEEDLSTNRLTDFFHKKPTDYAKNSQSFDPEDLF